MIAPQTVRASITTTVGRLSVGVLLLMAQTAVADPFTVELGGAYDRSELTSSGQAIVSLNPFEIRPVRIVDEQDSARLFASWYYDGASSGDGPLSRAAFTSRASSLRLSISDSESSAVTSLGAASVAATPNPPIIITPLPDPPVLLPDVPIASPFPADPPTTDSTQLSFGGRHVFKSTGWYLFGSVSYEDVDVSSLGRDGSGESTRLLAGFGRYVGKTTSLELAVVNVDSELRLGSAEFDDSSTEWLLALTHVADLGGSWDYGIDLAISTVERFGNDGSVNLRGSLYPNRSLAVGFEVVTSVESALDEGTRYGAFASWFVRPRFEVFADISTIEPRSLPGLKIENDSYGIGVRLRL